MCWVVGYFFAFPAGRWGFTAFRILHSAFLPLLLRIVTAVQECDATGAS
jgi:hypothetical protein